MLPVSVAGDRGWWRGNREAVLVALTEAQMEDCRRTYRQWLTTPPPCGINHVDIYNPCLPERDQRGLWCVMCGLRQRLALGGRTGGPVADDDEDRPPWE